MVSLIDGIVKEIALNSPEATADQITDYLIQLMENEVLPEALRNASFPHRPSPVQELRMRQWLKRVRKKRRPKEEQKLKMWRVVEQFEHIKLVVNGYPVNVSDLKPREFDHFDGTNVLGRARTLHGTLLRRRTLLGDGVPYIESRDVKRRTKELEKVLPYSPYKVKVEKVLGFYFDKMTYRKISSDNFFSRAVSVIESAAKLFALSKSIQANYFLSFRKDLEIPEWEKYILTANIAGLDFDRKMKIWDEFDTFIRKKIQERLLYAPGHEAKKLKELDKVLFTRLGLEAE